jgi:multidrug efflux pump subunit AcrA (membrane-fusion protein)
MNDDHSFDHAAGNSRRIVVMGLAMLVGTLMWAGSAEIEQNVRSTGQVIASSRTQVVQAANDGVVQTFEVTEGQRVKKGQLLVMLERNQAAAAYGDSTGKVAALEANLTRLRSEVFQRPLKFSKEVLAHPTFVVNQTELFNRRQQALHAELAVLEESRRLLVNELDMSRPLLATGDIGKVEVLRLERQLAELNGSMSNRRNKYFQDAQAEMTKAEEDLATQQQLLSERSTTLERTEIRAPADGLVRRLQVSTPGARVRAGDTVLELLPTDSRLIVEAKVKTADRGFIREGLAATVKLDAYDYSIYGALHGHVIYVSPDALTEQNKNGDHIYYQVQVALDEDEVARAKTATLRGGKPVPEASPIVEKPSMASFPGAAFFERMVAGRGHKREELEIQPGMTTSVEIRTGSQTVLKYLTKPVTKTLGESLTER